MIGVGDSDGPPHMNLRCAGQVPGAEADIRMYCCALGMMIEYRSSAGTITVSMVREESVVGNSRTPHVTPSGESSTEKEMSEDCDKFPTIIVTPDTGTNVNIHTGPLVAGIVTAVSTVVSFTPITTSH